MTDQGNIFRPYPTTNPHTQLLTRTLSTSTRNATTARGGQHEDYEDHDRDHDHDDTNAPFPFVYFLLNDKFSQRPHKHTVSVIHNWRGRLCLTSQKATEFTT